MTRRYSNLKAMLEDHTGELGVVDRPDYEEIGEVNPVGDTTNLFVMQTQKELDDIAEEGFRSFDIIATLEEIALIADEMEEITPKEIALIQTAANNAVAGTDISSDMILPATENFQVKSLAIEGIRDRISKIMQSITVGITNMIKTLSTFIDFSKKKIGEMRSGYSSITKELKNVKDGKLIIRSSVPAFCSPDGRAPSSAEEMVANMNANLKSLQSIFTSYEKFKTSIADEVIKATSGKEIDREKLDKAIKTHFKQFVNALKGSPYTDNGFSAYKRDAAGLTFTLRVGTDDQDLLHYLDTCRFKITKTKNDQLPTSFEVPAPSEAVSGKLQEAGKKYLDLLVEMQKSASKSIDKAKILEAIVNKFMSKNVANEGILGEYNSDGVFKIRLIWLVAAFIFYKPLLGIYLGYRVAVAILIYYRNKNS